MTMKGVHEFLVSSVGLLLVLNIWTAAPKAVASAGAPIKFRLSDGDEVICEPIGQQISLQNNKSWNRAPKTNIIPGKFTGGTHGVKRARQTIAVEKGGCPDGTYPKIGNRSSSTGNSPLTRRQLRRSLVGGRRHLNQVAGPPHEYAIATISTSTAYKGTEVFINLWKPFVESVGEFSLAQLWLFSNEKGSNREPLNTIEVGYQLLQSQERILRRMLNIFLDIVDFPKIMYNHSFLILDVLSEVYESLYGDRRPRLFVYWTADAYENTGCYDLDCAGFVQVSNKVLLQGSFTTISRLSGQQYEIKLRVFKDDKGTGDWWLQLNDENVGYWPKDLYAYLKDSASSIQWGGEIVDDFTSDGGKHTHTQMGSGEFANEGYRKAAFQRNLQYIDQDNTLVDAPINLFNSSASCYSVAKGQKFTDWGSYFFFGGKGYNPNCTKPVY